MIRKKIFLPLFILSIVACENRDVNSNDGPNFSEIHEDIHYHFDKVAIDGSEYFILERDRNNPHEGFGFMALKGTDIKNNQDSIKAYLKTLLEFQIKVSAKMNNTSVEATTEYADDLFNYYLNQSKSPYYFQEGE
ncbi:MAG: hypothetical protein JXR07_10175 [Reichenbachiella sp.]